MDIRIVNTCNNNCLYCLESSLRKKEKYIEKEKIFSIINNSEGKTIYFYGGNPLLHPDLLEIIQFCTKNGKKNIGLLSNSFTLDKVFISRLIENGLANFGLYFHAFDEKIHNLVNGGGILYGDFLKNLKLLSESNLKLKIIIHINKLNIFRIYKDILILYKNFGVRELDFVNYFPFDRPYDNQKILAYEFEEHKKYIDKLCDLLQQLSVQANFFKFPKQFFGDFLAFYNFENGILKQIGEEDIKILDGKNLPFCYNEKRCQYCFLQDNCRFYAGNHPS